MFTYVNTSKSFNRILYEKRYNIHSRFQAYFSENISNTSCNVYDNMMSITIKLCDQTRIKSSGCKCSFNCKNKDVLRK